MDTEESRDQNNLQILKSLVSSSCRLEIEVLDARV